MIENHHHSNRHAAAASDARQSEHAREAELVSEPENRWSRPITSRWDRFLAWLNMLFVDHAVFRYVWPNYWKVTDKLYRSAQPIPSMLRRFACDGGKTVVTLRGGKTFGSLPLEIETCKVERLTFTSFVMRSRGLPSAQEILSIPEFFETLEKPVLIHCKSGADRAGMMATLYLIMVEGKSVSEARRQLHWRFGHIKQSKTGILDALFDAYEADAKTLGRDHDPMPFQTWVETRYDRKTIKQAFQASGFWSLVGDRILRRE